MIKAVSVIYILHVKYFSTWDKNWVELKVCCLKLNADKADRDTDLFASHGLKHLLQLDAELLDVVEEDAGLQKQSEKNVRLLMCTKNIKTYMLLKKLHYISCIQLVDNVLGWFVSFENPVQNIRDIKRPRSIRLDFLTYLLYEDAG